MRRDTALLLLTLALGACSRHPMYGPPAPRDTTPLDDPPPPSRPVPPPPDESKD
jgi:hypothetical protein